jgi:hypothetical protein
MIGRANEYRPECLPLATSVHFLQAALSELAPFVLRGRVNNYLRSDSGKPASLIIISANIRSNHALLSEFIAGYVCQVPAYISSHILWLAIAWRNDMVEIE